ncbi:MAG TPA: hypothetical protein VKY31_02325, partial [Terriglobia bacterium]|nr:hypothetical protein [Terriglobia bacterium]
MTKLYLFVFGVMSVLIISGCTRDNSFFREFTGTWVITLDNNPFMVITLNSDGNQLKGTVNRPQLFTTTADGAHFTAITTAVKEWKITGGSINNGHLHFVATNPDDKTDTDEYDMAVFDKDHARIKIADAPFEPWEFSRNSNTLARVFTGWSQDHSYRLDTSAPSSAEMARIADEDQKARSGNFFKMSKQELAELGRQDAARRSQTRKLLDTGQLHTGADFSRASTVF